MNVRDMFVRDIEREISGVVKVAQTDENKIYQELDEYVVTKEISRHLSKFYDNYGKSIDGTTDKMGVWISGFFGSGKSHLLKILSYALDNQKVNGKYAIDYFNNKVNDPMLLAEMQRDAKVATETILFNIDSKNPVNNKSKEDAILRIFIKVFNEHRGLCDEIPGVANMEQQLMKDGVYEEFKQEFCKLRGKEWLHRRNAFFLDRDYVAKSISAVLNISLESANEYVTKGVTEYEVSIEKFAKEVKEYVDKKGNNFHLIFLVDEIGQYIGDNSTLMLNLQTVAEDLGTYCNGKVWIMVTSQESIDSLFDVKGNDFSKIQGRFDTRLSLSSISVDEVIKKRILDKKQDVIYLLKDLYREKSAILKNLISFDSARKDLLGYSDEKEFAEVYPFVPYQFKILQNVFEEVRKHGSSGKHLSEGERSMISAYKESVLKYADYRDGILIPFHAFYDTIEEFLNPSISRVIERASENPALKENPINLQILKILFMIKYLSDEIPGNLENIATLMVNSIDEDKLDLKEKIKESLRKLQSQTLIQKNGDSYVFLTDDEQDINREIKEEKIDEDAQKKELASYIFGDLYEETKYRYSKEYLFPFNKIMDDKPYSNQTSNMGINILSPLSDDFYKSDSELISMSYLNKQMIIKLGGSDNYIKELIEVMQIESYIKKKNVSSLTENIQIIITAKQGEIRLRKSRIKELLEGAILQAIFYVNGEKVDIKGASAKNKINSGFNVLVKSVFSKLGYIKFNLSSESEIVLLLKDNVEQLGFDAVEQYNNELAEKEVFDFICLQEDNLQQIRMKIILNRFKDTPYGWNEIDISGVVAKLFKEQKIKLRLNGEFLEIDNPNKIADALTKTTEIDRVIINKKIKVDDTLIRIVKNICLDVFGKINLPDDEDGLAKSIKDKINEKIHELKLYISKYGDKKYPGKSLFEKGIKAFNEIMDNKDNLSFFTALKNREDELLDWVEDVAYAYAFFENQINIFDKGLEVSNRCHENKDYLNEYVVQELKSLDDILNNPIPYKKIRNIVEIAENIEKGFNIIIEEKKENAETKINTDFEYCSLKSSQYGVSNSTVEKIKTFYDNLLLRVNEYADIFKIDASVTQSNNKKEYYEKLINKEIEEFKKKEEEETKKGNVVNEPPAVKHTPIQKQVEKIRVSKLVDIRLLKTENDVEIYIRELKNKLKKIIDENKEIEIE
ncbi:BREX system P-loop protein BrxC [Clostridium guangxiense]|uniref:BREX system P-loop protein BrxC n=1 Tax=Clostridium guangxiense TaxID=1662055 RepID=UPI001E31B224|nr:BREX system P-loop protein BrxC [Clostridium guangxiense]MCD2347232.1 BREX system P-loop protein BrxC [Clostridium guangxiense]